MKTETFSYTVKGHWPFPTDMLRHDMSLPVGRDDQEMIDRLSGDYAPDREAFEDVEINLSGPCKPNTARWESFGWSVPSDRDFEMWKGFMAEERKRREVLDRALGKLTDEERDVLKRWLPRA